MSSPCGYRTHQAGGESSDAHLKADNTEAYANAWTTVAHWCILASQGTTAGESLVSFAIEAIMEVEDEYLGKWLEQRLGTTMGPRPQGSEPAAMAQRGGPAGPMTQATFTADIGKGVALGLKALGGGYITREPSTKANEGGQ